MDKKIIINWKDQKVKLDSPNNQRLRSRYKVLI